MKQIQLGQSPLKVSEISLGCMRISKMALADIERLVKTAQEAGINFFDHADIYGGGKSEEQFATALKLTPAQREQIFLQTKCGICDGYYD